VKDQILADVARRMLVDRVTIEVVGALREAGLEPVLLKGPVIARWLYDGPGERTYDDVDLLLGPRDFEAGTQVLARLGFVRGDEPAREVPLPAGQQAHAETWGRGGDAVAVDLHRCLHHTEHLPPAQVWDEVWGDHTLLDVYGTAVSVPAVRVRTLHLVLHLQPKDVPGTRAWTDLERAIDRVGRDDWAAAAELADRFGVRDDMGALLALVPGGAELAGRLDLSTTPSDALLQEHRRHAPAIAHVARNMRRRTPGEAVRVVGAKLSPSRIRQVAPEGDGRPSLVRAYAHQAARLPAAVRDWVRYRRAGGRSLR